MNVTKHAEVHLNKGARISTSRNLIAHLNNRMILLSEYKHRTGSLRELIFKTSLSPKIIDVLISSSVSTTSRNAQKIEENKKKPRG